ncbi:uncharacterized protein LOC108742990 isoform X2 [Agrilus planipennis]|uniref:Uncharacterized protein LOC108742990 isoform X2 n=1 Tax=Agrilus planipennis TaxID=224129 RepID=A0A1W4XM82_AGRPL|nr:uncharacterized protein LOC108742990 isoform X2 [Agrilus planipennis]
MVVEIRLTFIKPYPKNYLEGKQSYVIYCIRQNDSKRCDIAKRKMAPNTLRKKIKKFRPTRIPRYLPGQVTKDVLEADLKMFNDFRRKIFYVESKIDTKPPPMNPYRFIKADRLLADANKLFEIDKRNKQLLRNINLINRHGGRVDSFNPNAYTRQSKWRAQELKMREITKHNKKIYVSILSAESDYSVKKMNEFWKYMIEKFRYVCKMPVTIFDKISHDQILRSQPSISGGLEATADRPLVVARGTSREVEPVLEKDLAN